MKSIEIKVKDSGALAREILSDYKPKKFSYPKISWHVYNDSHGTLETSTYLEISTKYGEKESITLVHQEIGGFDPEIRAYKDLAQEFVDEWNSNPKTHWNKLLKQILEHKRYWAQQSYNKAESELSLVDKKLEKLRKLNLKRVIS